MKRAADMFDATVYDNTATGCREVWINGKPTRYCRKNAISPHAVWPEMRAPWLSYPDVPSNTQQAD